MIIRGLGYCECMKGRHSLGLENAQEEKEGIACTKSFKEGKRLTKTNNTKP